ncbi:hypothetical protein HF086_013693 [Spodoptera exigua]|uniref:Uncharacterized protein n=1 Tax=Spodoptera exigua TaxID=7107 RepID=A0A922SHW2_SPOEX|nr:hypothetical protein HF086_013693 [Spodoptera exigua]
MVVVLRTARRTRATRSCGWRRSPRALCGSLTETARLLQNVRSVFSRRSATRATMELELSREYLHGTDSWTANAGASDELPRDPLSARPHISIPSVSYSVATPRTADALNTHRDTVYLPQTSWRTCQDGFAFSQEEGGSVSQADMIRAYDTRQPRPQLS